MDTQAAVPTARSGSVPLLATKLFVPRVRQSLVPRQHLVEHLNSCRKRQLTLVSAPAGFGKTTLVSAWAQDLEEPVAWLSLDKADNDPARFASYFVAALQQVAAALDAPASQAIGQDLQAAFDSPNAPPLDYLMGSLINDLMALPSDFLLVLDDFHVIDNESVHAAMRNLVAHQPPQMHLIILTREDPQIPLARLRASGQLVELRAQDLRFTPAEASIFLNDVMGLALDAQAVDELDAQIEGWIAGLQLAALSMQNRENPAELIRGLSGSHHYILSYLTEEVLRQLSPEVQAFLLQTSMLTQLTGPLCDAVTGRTQSRAMLESLYASNAFVIPLDDEHEWFRYHHLFADLLRNQFKRTQAQDAATLHQRASEWYEKQGMAPDAIEHAFAAGDYPRTVRLLESHTRRVVLQGYAQTVEEWLRRLPQDWRIAGPRTNLAFALSLLLRGHLGEIEPYLHDAEAAIAERRQLDGDPGADALLAETLSLRAGLAAVKGDPARAALLAQEAVAIAPQSDPYVRGMAHFFLGTAYNYAGRVVEAIETYHEALPLCRAAGNTVAVMLAVANLALLHVMRGQLRAAAALCRETIEAASRSGDLRSPALAAVYGSYSYVLYEWGDLEAARQQAEQCLSLSRRGGHVAALAYAAVVLSRIQLARNDVTAAADALSQALQLRQRGMPAWVLPEIVAQQVALALAQDDEDTAAQVLALAGAQPGEETDFTHEVLHIAQLRLLCYLAHKTSKETYFEQALALAKGLLASAEPAGRLGRVLETLTLRALVFQLRGDMSRAREDLQRALALAAPEGYTRIFVNEGAPMARLLQTAQRRDMDQAHIARLLALLAPAAGTGVPPQPDLAEALTERELEVLRLIAKGLPYAEIAQQLVVSLNTVRFHVKGIYGKLGVNNRAAAVDRARASKLF
ncbi:MAG: AAA family ATPase [Caldilineaceae bacterium]|nr:AAA family ATPase [Caldilineaceae bacterium]